MLRNDPALQLVKVTTSYEQNEDRLRIAGEDEQGNALVLWLTQRLANRLVDALLHWLDGGEDGEDTMSREVVQAWRQDAALLEWQGGTPVEPGLAAPEWLVESVDIARALDRYTLAFRGGGGEQAALPLSGQELRQWLAIVHGLYRQAEWPSDMWPVWFTHPSPGRVARAVH